MKIQRWVGACLLAVGACQGENSVVGESGTDPLTGTEGPQQGGTTHQFLSPFNFSNDPALCMPARLPVSNGAASCVVVEVVGSDEEHADCTCSGPARRPASAALAELVQSDMLFQGFCQNPEDCAAHCFCEVEHLTGSAGALCENEAAAGDAVGWCYISPEQGLGNPELVEHCPATEQRQLRVLGIERQSEDDLYYIACQGTDRQVTPAKLGETCVVGSEFDPTFSGFFVGDASTETQSPACESGVCLVNHLQGRASCPYGQSEDQAASAPACFVPGSGAPVTAAVPPQLVARRETTASICSCRCDGPGDGPFCACPESMECVPLFGDIGLEGQVDIAGSYCVPKGSEFDVVQQAGEVCTPALGNCGEGTP